jgi:hypothetical protein
MNWTASARVFENSRVCEKGEIVYAVKPMAFADLSRLYPDWVSGRCLTKPRQGRPRQPYGPNDVYGSYRQSLLATGAATRFRLNPYEKLESAFSY